MHFSAFQKLSMHIAQINDLACARSVLDWDARTQMPVGGSENRARQISTLTIQARNLLLSKETKLLVDAAQLEVTDCLSDEYAALKQVVTALAWHVNMPEKLLARMAELGSLGQDVWAHARATNDYESFEPILIETVDLNRELAECVGYTDHPYDAILDLHEPGQKTEELVKLLNNLVTESTRALVHVQQMPTPDKSFLQHYFPLEGQRALARELAQSVGYDFSRGRLDTATHPCEYSFTRQDVRLTIRFDEYSPEDSIFSLLHETGHGLYEQNISNKFVRGIFDTNLIGLLASGGTSLGMHESQSRLWENQIGRSLPFWELHLSKAREFFPEQLENVTPEQLWHAVNIVRPGLIRTNADELSYDLHIALRVDIERRLMERTLEVRDIRDAWASGMKTMFGFEPENDRDGVLQDMHWGAGAFGSFCTYTIGNIAAAQLYEAACRDNFIELAIQNADYRPLFEWLNKNVWCHGRRYNRDEILLKATGSKLDSQPLIRRFQSLLQDHYST